jgi:hypothetical protein
MSIFLDPWFYLQFVSFMSFFRESYRMLRLPRATTSLYYSVGNSDDHDDHDDGRSPILIGKLALDNPVSFPKGY